MNSLRREKAGRNDPCPCGSGFKYKKCCLRQDQTVIPLRSSFSNKREEEGNEGRSYNKEAIVMTITHEPLMPIRLYYQIFDQEGFLQKLHQLDCVRFESKNRFFICYEKEARNLLLSVPYNKVPKDFYPVILAFGHLIDGNHLQLDLRSFERGLSIIEFIDQWIGRSFAKITHLASYNKVSTSNNAADFAKVDFDAIFAESNMVIHDPEETMKTLQEALDQAKNETERQKIRERHWEQRSQQDLIVVEKYPIYFYEEGIEQVETTLMIRSIVAMEHWKGNTACKPIDILQKIFNIAP